VTRFVLLRIAARITFAGCGAFSFASQIVVSVSRGVCFLFRFGLSSHLHIFFEIRKCVAEQIRECGMVRTEEGTDELVMECMRTGRDEEGLAD
jgi:hypothetical protein